MSWQASFDQFNIVVPNVVTNWTEVDVPSGLPNTIDNPDISLFGTGDYQKIQPINNSTVVGQQMIPFTAQQQQAWNAALAAAALAQLISQAQGYLTGTDALSIFLQALIQEMPVAQGLPVPIVSAAISQNVQTIANGVIIKT